MSGFDTPALLTAVRDILVLVAGVQDTVLGVPTSFSARVTAYVCTSGQTFPDQLQTFGPGAVFGRMTRTARVVIGFGYATGISSNDPTDREAVESAELTLAGYVDDCVRKLLTDATLESLIEDLSIRLDLNDLPEYRDWSGREVRHFWILVECQQSEEM